MEKEYKILKEAHKLSTKLMRDNRKYFSYDRDRLEMLVMMLFDIIEHQNEFLMELKENVK